MDWTPVMSGAVGGASGLIGAVIGYVGNQRTARASRTADRRSREVSRLISALGELESAYAAYAAHSGSPEDFRLLLADRSFDRAVGLASHRWVRKHCSEYGKDLRTFYLYLGTDELDELDADAQVPSADELKRHHQELIDELRNYESN